MKEKTAIEMLQEMDARRDDQRKKIEEDIRKWETIRDNAAEEMCKTANDPDLFERYTVAENKLKTAYKKIYDEKRNLKLNESKKTVLVGPEETKDFIRIVNKENTEKLLPIAAKMLDIAREFLKLSRDAYKIEVYRNTLIKQWDEEVSVGNTNYDTTFQILPGSFETSQPYHEMTAGFSPKISLSNIQSAFNSILAHLKSM